MSQTMKHYKFYKDLAVFEHTWEAISMKNSEKILTLAVALAIFATMYVIGLIFYFIPYLEAAYESTEYVIEHEILNYFLQFDQLPDYNLTLLFLSSPAIFSYIISALMYTVSNGIGKKE